MKERENLISAYNGWTTMAKELEEKQQSMLADNGKDYDRDAFRNLWREMNDAYTRAAEIHKAINELGNAINRLYGQMMVDTFWGNDLTNV